MSFTDSRGSTVAIVAVGFALVFAPMGAPALVGVVNAADPVFDNEATDTGTTSDYTGGGGETLNGFEASESNYTYLEADNMTADGAFEVRDPDLGDVVIARNASLAATNSSQGYYAANISNDNLDDLQIAPNQNKSVEIAAINDTTADNPDETNITVYFVGEEGRTVRYVGASNLEVGDEDVSDAFASAGTDGFTVAGITVPNTANDFATVDDEAVTINGSNSTVSYAFANDTAVSGLDSPATNLDAGTWMPLTVLRVTDPDADDADAMQSVRVYLDEAPDSVDTSSDTYAIYDSAEDDLDIHFGDEYDNTSEVDVSVNSRRGLLHRYGAAANAYGIRDVASLGSLNPLLLGGGSQIAGLGLIFFGVRREQKISASESTDDPRQRGGA